MWNKYSFLLFAVVFWGSQGVFASTITHVMKVTEKGFEPSQLNAAPGSKVILKITRVTDNTCATAVQVPAFKIKKDLPLNQEVVVELAKVEKGKIKFGCLMDMMDSAVVIVE